MRLDIACGERKPQGFFGIDIYKSNCTDLVHDLNTGIPLEDNSCEYVRAYDAIEHFKDQNFLMSEIWRVCSNGATVEIRVPSTDGRGAFQDPTHVSFWNINSFMYYCDNYPGYLKMNNRNGFKGKFHALDLHNENLPGNIVYTIAKLTAVKD